MLNRAMQTLPPPFDSPILQEQISDLLIRYHVDDRVMHAVLKQLADLVNQHQRD